MKDRVVQYPNRITLTNISTQESTTYDMARAEGSISEAGTVLNSTNLLSSNTVARLGITEDRTPDQFFNDIIDSYSDNYDAELIADSTDLYTLSITPTSTVATGTIYYDSSSTLGVITSAEALSSGSAYTIGTLPSEYRPSTAISDYDSNGNAINITTAGVISITPKSAITSGTAIYFYAEW